MGYTMKRGNSGIKFKDLGSSPAKQDGKIFSGEREKKKTTKEIEQAYKEFDKKTVVIDGKTYDKAKKGDASNPTIDYSKLSGAQLQALREKKSKSPAKQGAKKPRELSKEKGDLFLKGKTKDKDGNIVDIKWAPNPVHDPDQEKRDVGEFMKKYADDNKEKSPAKQIDPQKARQDSINKIDAKMEALEEDRFNEKITQEDYNEKIKALRVREKEVKKALPKEK